MLDIGRFVVGKEKIDCIGISIPYNSVIMADLLCVRRLRFKIGMISNFDGEENAKYCYSAQRGNFQDSP